MLYYILSVFVYIYCLKQVARSWKVGVINSTRCSSRGPEFGPQHPWWLSEDLKLSSVLHRRHTHHKLNETNNNSKTHMCSWVLCYIFTTPEQFSKGLWDRIPLAESPAAFHTHSTHHMGRHTFLPTPHLYRTCRSILGSKGAGSRGCSGWSWLVSTLSCTIINRKLC